MTPKKSITYGTTQKPNNRAPYAKKVIAISNPKIVIISYTKKSGDIRIVLIQRKCAFTNMETYAGTKLIEFDFYIPIE